MHEMGIENITLYKMKLATFFQISVQTWEKWCQTLCWGANFLYCNHYDMGFKTLVKMPETFCSV